MKHIAFKVNREKCESLSQQHLRVLIFNNSIPGTPIDAIGLQSHIKGQDLVDINSIKYHVDQLWEEFKLPIWITEFDWNADKSVEFGDHTFHAEQLEKFYRLMFSHEVSSVFVIYTTILMYFEEI